VSFLQDVQKRFQRLLRQLFFHFLAASLKLEEILEFLFAKRNTAPTCANRFGGGGATRTGNTTDGETDIRVESSARPLRHFPHHLRAYRTKLFQGLPTHTQQLDLGLISIRNDPSHKVF